MDISLWHKTIDPLGSTRQIVNQIGSYFSDEGSIFDHEAQIVIMSKLFDIEKSQTKDEWLEQVQKDLRGKSLSSILCEVDRDRTLDPLYTDREVTSFPPIYWRQDDNAWKMSARWTLSVDTDPTILNAEILTYLEGGCEQIEIYASDLSEWNAKAVFQGVLLDLIGVRVFCHPMMESELEKVAEEFILERNLRMDNINFIVLNSKESQFTLRNKSGLSSPEQLASLCREISNYIEFIPHAAWDKITIAYEMDNDILVDICRLRTIKLLVYALANKVEFPLYTFPNLQANIGAQILEDELESIIEKGSKAFTAVLGSVDEIYIDDRFQTELPLTTQDKSRIIRNIQWLLRSESKLDATNDPTNGAYWIEYYTRELFESTWNIYMKGGEV